MPGVKKGKGGPIRNTEALHTGISPGGYRDVVRDTSSDEDDNINHAEENTLLDTSLVLDVEGENSPVKVTKTRKVTTFTETTRADTSPVTKRTSPRLEAKEQGCARTNKLYPNLPQWTAEDSESNVSYGSSPNERSYRKATYASSPEGSRNVETRYVSSPEQSTVLPRGPIKRKKGTTVKKSKPTPELDHLKQPESLDSTNNSLYIIYGVCIVGVLLLVIIAVISQSSKQAVVPEKPQGRALIASNFKLELVDLKQRFPSQSTRTWAVLRAAVLGVMKVDTPSQPAVIMLASTIENRDVTHCLAKQLAEIVTKVYDASRHVELSTYLGKSLSPADLKLEFDTTMHRGFSSGSKAVVIHDIQEVHGDAAMIFHAFCDNENAPYKDAVLIFTVHLQSKSLKENDVDSYLEHIWADHIGLDNAAALLSRIGTSVAIVSKEEEEDVKHHC